MSDIIRVLLVDDEDGFIAALSKRLDRRGMSVSTASGGEEAMALLETESYDVMVLDVKMPRMDGMQVLSMVKSRHPALEVILLTGHADMNCALEALSAGAFDFLIKPVGIELLACRIMAAAKGKSLRGGCAVGDGGVDG
ncbi:MAG: response regulator [Pseudodesulfovibrio sp.]|uniref:Response regulator receiver n=1 Tax=Pseudodesulfovibrio aespoeensis (strain ATCC 700646 / DSM 10631 / Aspo-2) TaxID=643562 RepID=E6VSP2_PSEA9|nr:MULTISPECIES: response regulator [Pseudodesulfovibrio]ADU62027.1 response regulator receiver [Pseudodesulfovibrio aespoeensis Aspo-2]MBV1766206.1 response regulator [Pseudodesulfovibrio sp.]MBV1772340.1 response regulator [Pseudodesulfovibrio sp.]MCG2732894.1 response regulator [Pseudodesulfovibrio aespoeensis]